MQKAALAEIDKTQIIEVSPAFTAVLSTLTSARGLIEKASQNKNLKELLELKTKMAVIERMARDANGLLMTREESHKIVLETQRLELRAERACGFIIPEKFSKGNPKLQKSQGATIGKLEDYGLTKSDSSRMQRLAKMPAKHFDSFLETSERITRNALIQSAKEIETEIYRANPEPVELPSKKELVPQIYFGDCKLCNLKDNSVDVILTDPPWSLNKFRDAWESLVVLANRVLKPGGHLVCYTGDVYLDQVVHILGQKTEFGQLEYEWVLCSLLTEGHQRMNWYLNEWRPILVYIKLPRDKCRHGGDLITTDHKVKSLHEWGQGIEGAATILEKYSQPGDLLLEPFAGGGSFIQAAIQKERRVVAYEKDPDTYRTLKKRFPGACKD